MIIRSVRQEDAEAILSIYAPYIENGAVSFEYDVPSADEIRSRIRRITEKYPWLVMESGGVVIGYAYASPFREREAYQWKAEVSVYVSDDAKGTGVAKALYDQLLSQLKNMGMVSAIAGMTVPNPETERFHEKYGFKKIAEFPKVGFKNGEWHSVAFMELQLNEYGECPNSPWKQDG